MRPCYTFTAAANATQPAILALDDEIGFWGTQAKDFRAALDSVSSDSLEVQINSPGGDVFAGLGMYNMLRNWAAAGKSITVRVTALAGSIASVIALAGDKRVMPKNAFAMLHSASGGVFGTEEEIRDYADTMSKVNGSLRSVYVDRMGVPEEKAVELMAKDTWLTAEECLDLGFATELSDAVSATAKFDLGRAALPENVAAVFKPKAQADDEAAKKAAEEAAALEAKAKADAEAQAKADAEAAKALAASSPVAEQIVARAKAAGLEAHAVVFALNCATLAEADKRMAEARDIVALCNVAGKPQAAGSLIREGKPVADVRKSLLSALAESDEHIDTEPKPGKTNGGNANPTGVSPTALWDSHRKATTKGR